MEELKTLACATGKANPVTRNAKTLRNSLNFDRKIVRFFLGLQYTATFYPD